MEPIKFNFKSVNYCYYKFGTGPKHVLVLHGWGSKISSWAKFFELADKTSFTYFFIEMPGFGASPNPPSEWSVDNYKEFAQSFVSSQPEAIPYLLVHSFGGRVAIKLLNEPHSFRKAVFVGAAGIKPKLALHKRLVKKVSPLFRWVAKSRFIKRIIYKILGATDYVNAEGTMKGTFVKVIDEDLTSLIPSIDIPVQLVWGRRDSYTPPSMARKMNKLIKVSNLIILKNARHGVHMQTPQKLANIAEEFFN